MNGWGGRLALALVAGVVACTDDSTAPTPVPTPTSVVLSPVSLRLASLGETAQLTATVLDQNGQVMAGATVAWVSAHPSVATVDGNGLVLAAGNGATNITVTSGTTATASVGITVEQVAVTIVLSAPPDSMAVGDSIRMSAKALDALGNPIQDVTFEWSSSDTTIASVDQQGWVRARTAGSTEIAVTAGTAASATVAVSVVQMPAAIVLSAPRDSVMIGDSIQLAAEAFDRLGAPITDVTFTWSSSDTTIATVDLQGWVRARAAGTVAIGVELGELNAATFLVILRDEDEERAALEAFYHATSGPEWKNNTNWLTDKPLGEWYGVETDAYGTVVGLHFVRNGLSGQLSAELVHLTALEKLSVWGGRYSGPGQSLTGPIPPELAGLVHLKALILGHNELSGEIPAELAHLANLTELSLSSNDLTGSIPPELGDLADLERLSLANNLLTGEIPRELGNLTGLRHLDLSGNRLTGEIPLGIGNLVELVQLSLGHDDLSGEIPSKLGNLAKLEYLSLAGTAVSGSIPPELGRLSQLRSIWMPGNELTGSIPPELGQLHNLEKVVLLDNNLSGPIPPELGALSRLEALELAANPLTGTIPSELGSLTQLTSLHLGETQLGGPIPQQLGNLVNLERLFLGGNLTGVIPPELGNLVNLGRLDIVSHSLTGPIPRELGRLSNLTSLLIKGHGITGSIPTDLWTLANLEYLALQYAVTGSIPAEIENLVNLEILQLVRGGRGTGLTGPLPSELGKLPNLRGISIAYHDFTGPLPPELGNLSGLTALTIVESGLSGAIPPDLAKLVDLKWIWLDSNHLSGSLPPELGSLAELEVVRVGNNNLEGRVPDTFVNLDLDEFQWHNNPLCLPDTPDFRAWRGGIPSTRGSYCGSAAAVAADGTLRGVRPTVMVEPLISCALPPERGAHEPEAPNRTAYSMWKRWDGGVATGAPVGCPGYPPDRPWPYR